MPFDDQIYTSCSRDFHVRKIVLRWLCLDVITGVESGCGFCILGWVFSGQCG